MFGYHFIYLPWKLHLQIEFTNMIRNGRHRLEITVGKDNADDILKEGKGRSGLV